MPIIEITQFRLKGVTPDDPALLESLSQVRGKLQTNSRFFSCFEESSLLYIFGVWPSLDAHLKFLASPTRDEVLGPQDAILDFQWTIHVELDAISPLLLDAPFLAFERFRVDTANVHLWSQVVEDHTRDLQSNDRFNVAWAWRCDAPAGKHEAVVLTSWSSEDLENTKAGKRVALGGNQGGFFRTILFHRAWNVERARSGT